MTGTDNPPSLAQAKTGTGKTVAFLIPIIQRILQDPKLQKPSSRRTSRNDVSDIRAMIVSPTRELAEQIAVEAQKLVRHTGIIIQTAVGGTQKMAHMRQMQREGCHLLVGTPGRLNDIFSDPSNGVSAPGLQGLVLDEADRLLDQGFYPAIQDLVQKLPDINTQDRQTLLFSATVPHEVMGLVQETLKPSFKFVRTVQEGETPTHERVPQKFVPIVGFENENPALLELCKREMKESSRPFKAIVYYNSTAEVTLATKIFQNLRQEGSGLFGPHPLAPARFIEIHAKLTQSQRTKAAETFRRCKTGILFSSDVTARGMDFPGVTHIIQMGLPNNKDTYVHRIGRTARAGQEGTGYVFVTDLAQRQMRRQLTKLPITKDDSLAAAAVDMSQAAQIPQSVATILNEVSQATRQAGSFEKDKVYLSHLGRAPESDDKRQYVELLNRQARFGWGLETPPSVPAMLLQKLGLNRIPGLASRAGREGGESSYQGGRSFGDRGGSGGRGGYSGARGGGRSFGDRGRSSGDRERSSDGYGSFRSERRGRSSDAGGRGGFGERSTNRY